MSEELKKIIEDVIADVDSTTAQLQVNVLGNKKKYIDAISKAVEVKFAEKDKRIEKLERGRKATKKLFEESHTKRLYEEMDSKDKELSTLKEKILGLGLELAEWRRELG